ncbi:MAG: helix-turn-helix transcriptional regulator [Burkholderiales bacterium]
MLDNELAQPSGSAATPLSEDLFLAQLGERVRGWRARRGMTRKTLALQAGVSERHLAQLETGKGNVSVLLLQQIALALDIELATLFQEKTQQHIELQLLNQVLQRLPENTLTQVRKRLTREHGNREQERMQRIALIGLRGAGKSTLGVRLAKELNAPFIELDREVERLAGTNLSELFLLYGQAGYRRYERLALERVLQDHDRAVIATGGTIVSEAAIFDLLLSTCYTVWLKAEPEEHMARVAAQGDMRPMEGHKAAMDDLKQILRGRNGLYAKADATVDTSGLTVVASMKQLKLATVAASNP